MKWVRRAGFFLIALGLVPWGLWTLFDSKRTWSLANDVPITLSQGSHYTTGVVKTNTRAGIGRGGRLARNEPRSLRPGVSDRRSLS
jgi:hypothetical protein